MEEKDWNMLTVLNEEMNITRAAKKLYTSQPALSYRIKQLEQEFDIEILHRGNKGITFTPEGEYLVHYAREMQIKNRALKDHLSNMKEGLSGTLRIGSSSNYAHYELPDVLEKFIGNEKNVDVELVTGWSSHILEQLQNEKIHVAFIRGDLNWSGEKKLLQKEELKVISINELSLSDLPKENYIHYHTDPFLKTTIEKWWNDTFDMPMHQTMEVDRIDTSIELVKRGLGITIVPSLNVETTKSIYTLPLKINGEPIYRNTWLIYKKESLNLKVVKAFIEMMDES